MLHERYLFNLLFIASCDKFFISGKIWAMVAVQHDWFKSAAEYLPIWN